MTSQCFSTSWDVVPADGAGLWDLYLADGVLHVTEQYALMTILGAVQVCSPGALFSCGLGSG